MFFQWNPLVFPLLIAGITAIILAFRLIPQFKIPGTKVVIGILICAAIWVLSYGMELSSTQIEMMLIWEWIQNLGLVFLPTLLLIFTINSFGRRKWLKFQNLLILSVVPLVFVGLAISSSNYELIWGNSEVVRYNQNIYLSTGYGPAFWVIWGYAIVILLITEGVLFIGLRRSLIINRNVILTLMASTLLPIFGGAVDYFKIGPLPHFQILELASWVTSLSVIYNLQKIRSGDLSTVSRTSLFKELTDGILVLDENERIVDINKSALKLIKGERNTALMMPISKVWPQWEQVKDQITNLETHGGITLGFGESGTYDISTSSLRDWRDILLGQIILLRDVTDYENRTEEISALLEISNAVSGTLDINQVLIRLAEKLLEISKMDICTISEWESGKPWVRSLVEYSQSFWFSYTDIYAISEYPTTDRVLRSGQPFVIRKDMDDPEVRWMNDVGIGVLLMVPLYAKDQIVGIVEIGSNNEDAEISSEDIQKCQAILARVANRLEMPLKKNGREGLVSLAKTLVKQGWGSTATISEWNRNGNYVWSVAEYSEMVWPLDKGPISPLDRWPTASRVLERGTGEIVKRSDPRYPAEDKLDLEIWGAQMVIVLPISIHGDPIGVVELYNTYEERQISADEIKLWQAIADQAAVAIMNAKLYEKAQQEIRERARIEHQLRHDAYHDSLTGLPNRALLLDRLNSALYRSRRSSKYRFAVLFLDIDDFKNVNDSFGHVIGDKLLVEIAYRLTNCVREMDTIARLGGDEFVLLIETVMDDHQVTYVANRVQNQLTSPFHMEGIEILTSSSIGIVIDGEGYDNAEDILRDADIALYRAKDHGKARFEIFDPAMRETILNRLKMEADLRKAVEENKLNLAYQPIINIATGEIEGCETLTRWSTSNGKVISPSTFIPIAEETGMIIPLGTWVLKQACQQFKAWQQSYEIAQRISLSVNCSSVQIFQLGFVDKVKKTLLESGLAGQNLSIEVTEGTVIQDFKIISRVIRDLKSLGVQVHLDDFGKGYSSLSYISQLPFDVIKIDRYFMSQFNNPDVRGILKFIVLMSHDLGKRVIAEGVETQPQRHYLAEIGCEYGQGFLFSKAVDATALQNRYFNGNHPHMIQQI